MNIYYSPIRNMIRFNVLLIILLGAFSCDPGVVFKEANPPSVAAINEIPESFQGTFMCESDSTILRINKFDVVNESYFYFETAIQDVEESEYCAIVDGGLHFEGREECFPFDYIGEDSVGAKIYYLDTLFSFKTGEVAKLYKEQLFINTLNDQGDWLTWLLRPNVDGNLEFSLVYVPEKEDVVAEITDDYETRQLTKDRLQYSMKPTLAEFEEILNRDYTRICEILIPINVEFEYPF